MDDYSKAQPSTPRDASADNPAFQDPVQSMIIHEISWSAVFAGVAIALVTQLLLNMLGVGFGAASVDATNSQAPGTAFSIGAAIWWAISGIVAAGVGGYAAGRLSGRSEGSTTAWHGLTAWAFTTLLLFYLVTTTVGSIVGGAASVVGNIGGSLAQSGALPTAVGSVTPFGAIEQQVLANSNDPASQRAAAVSALQELMAGPVARQSEARERAVQALSRATNVPVEQARGTVATYEQQYRQAVDQARQAAAQTADAAARATFWSMLAAVVALALGAAAAWWAGREAAVSPTIVALTRRVRWPPSQHAA